MRQGGDMIANATELKTAVRQLRIMEKAFQSLREELEISCQDLFAAAARPYTRRIETLQADIVRYLADHPA
jgi:hypothetical protein